MIALPLPEVSVYVTNQLNLNISHAQSEPQTSAQRINTNVMCLCSPVWASMFMRKDPKSSKPVNIFSHTSRCQCGLL